MNLSETCALCGGKCGPDDDGLTKKTISRDATDILCTACLAKRLGTTPQALENMALTLRRRGCQLFRPLEDWEK